VITATAGLFALLPLAPAAAAEPREVVLKCDNGRTYTTLQRPGTAVFKDTKSRTVLVVQSVDDTDFTGVPDRLRTTCRFKTDGEKHVGEFLITPAR
jgi:hypothetical protein